MTQQPSVIRPLSSVGLLRLSLSFLLILIIGYAVLNYPLMPAVLGGCLLIYGYVLHRYPNSWLFCVPALLPVLDFTPYTGRFFFDEFDLLLLTTLTVQLCQKQPKPISTRTSNPLTGILLCLFCVAYGISLIRGIWPLQAIDANAFSNYYSNYNSLRIGKGLLWALLLMPALKNTLRIQPNTLQLLVYGLLSGLTGVIVISLWERLVSTGLFDFSSHYRINALFSTMHTGGGHIESYLMLTLPFISVLFFPSPGTLITRVWGIFLFITGLYTLLVTFSRGGYIGFAVGFLVLLACLIMRTQGAITRHWKQTMTVLLLVAIIPVLAMPVFQGQLIKQRFSIYSEDKSIRNNHWQDTIAMMDDTLATQLFGMGLGSHPRTYFWSNTENVVPATYTIENDGLNAFLRLRAGDALFMGQLLNQVTPHTHYQLRIKARSTVKNSTLNAAICEKSLLFSLSCTDASISLPNTENGKEWQTLTYTLDTGEIGVHPGALGGLLSRPVQLSLSNSSSVSGDVIDIDDVQLINSDGKNLLNNGDFTNGLDRWFFTAEKHHPWHILNVWVHVFFDQGVVGLALFILLLLNCIYTMLRNRQKTPYTAIFLSSLCAFLVVGWVDSPFDAPRITLLFCLILAASQFYLCSLSHEKT